MKKVLVTGALGQIGSELVERLWLELGEENVIATDIRLPEEDPFNGRGIYERLDVMDRQAMDHIAQEYQVDTIIHLAALLSAKGEEQPLLAWDLNMNGLLNALEVARELNLKFFTPSSIGAFGPNTPKDHTPQDTIQRPTTIYGISKVAGELLCDYYYRRFGVDTRGVRFPGLISYKTPPGGGTTDYAVDIFYGALREKRYTCFLKPGSYMDMLYMPDALEAIIRLLNASPEQLVHRNAFNVTAMHFDPVELERAIRKYIPDFKMDYDIDPVRQAIADSWPNSIDSSCAMEEWGFQPKYDLDAMVRDMLENLGKRLSDEENLYVPSL